MKVSQKERTPSTLTPALQSLGQALRAKRLALGVTQEEAAFKCSLSRKTVSRMESGDPSVAVGQLLRYGAALGVQAIFAPAAVFAAAPEVDRARARRPQKAVAMLDLSALGHTPVAHAAAA